MTLQHVNPETVLEPSGYTQVVRAPGSTTVFVSGQVPINARGEVVGEGDLKRQTEQVFENIKDCLASVGATLADIAKTTTFVVDYKPGDRELIAETRRRYLSEDRPPAGTLVGVQALTTPNVLIEVEAIAVMR